MKKAIIVHREVISHYYMDGKEIENLTMNDKLLCHFIGSPLVKLRPPAVVFSGSEFASIPCSIDSLDDTVYPSKT